MAERGGPHNAATWMYRLAGTSWNFVGMHPVGDLSRNENSAGRVDFSYGYNTNSPPDGIDLSKPDSRILATGNALTYLHQPSTSPYGIQSTPESKWRSSPYDRMDHYYADYNGELGNSNGPLFLNKNFIGDVEAYRVPHVEQNDMQCATIEALGRCVESLPWIRSKPCCC